MTNKINIFILAFITLILICIIFYWGDYLIKNNYIRREKEGFTTIPSINLENADTWLDSIDKKPIKRLSESKPDLPL